MTDAVIQEPAPDTNLILLIDGVIPFEARCRIRKNTLKTIRLLGKSLFSYRVSRKTEGRYIEYIHMPSARLSIGVYSGSSLYQQIISAGSLRRALTSRECVGVVNAILEDGVDPYACYDLSPKTNDDFFNEEWAEEKLQEFYESYSRNEIDNDNWLMEEEGQLIRDCDPANAKYLYVETKVILDTGQVLELDEIERNDLQIAGHYTRDGTFYDFEETREFERFSSDHPLNVRILRSDDGWATIDEISEDELLALLSS